jgi:hypothetical protein
MIERQQALALLDLCMTLAAAVLVLAIIAGLLH